MPRSGAGESGKSTVLKQMKLIYAQGFSKTEKLEWKPVVFNNIIQSFRLIFDAMNDLGYKLDSEDNEVSVHGPGRSSRGLLRKPELRFGPLTRTACCRKLWPTSWSTTN